MNWILRQLRKGLNPRTYVLLGLLLAVLLWIQALDARQNALRAKVGAGGAPAAAIAAVPATAARRAKVEAVSPGWGENPFARRFSAADDGGTARAASRTRSAGRSARATGLYLQGVMSGPLGRSALINGNVVHEGERVGGREVLQIGRRSVVLLENGTVVTLNLQGEGR